MKSSNIVLSIFLWAIVIFALPVKPVYAYLDAGTGSYVLQMIIAGAAGILVSIRIFWGYIKQFFMSIFSKKKPKLAIKTDQSNTKND